MVIDIVCVGFILLYALFGFFTGGLKQVVRLAALVLGYLIAKLASPIAADILDDLVSLDPNLLNFISLGACWIIAYIILSFIGNLIIATLHGASETISTMDKVLGILVGMLKAIIIVYILVTLFSAVEAKIYKHQPAFRKVVKESIVIRLISNPSSAKDMMPDDIQRLLDLAEAASDKEKAKKMRGDPAMQKLMDLDSFKSVVRDKQLSKDIKSGSLLDAIGNEKFQNLLKDHDFQKLIPELMKTKPPTDVESSGQVEPDR